jgi:CheY-like chemotaxis protein
MERADFSSHRVLILGGKTHTVTLLRSIMNIIGLTRITLVEDKGRALELLSMEHFTSVFFDPRICGLDGMHFAAAARRQDGMLNPMIPIFALQDRARRRDVEKARDAGVTDVITAPISPRTLMTKLQTAVSAPRPFIVSSQFFGPDRRSRARPPYYGSDRRIRVVKKAKMDFTHI